MHFGDKYVQVLGQGVKSLFNIKNYDLKNNRISG